MKSIGRSVLHHDPKLAVMVEENLANRAENSDDGVDQEDDIRRRKIPGGKSTSESTKEALQRISAAKTSKIS